MAAKAKYCYTVYDRVKEKNILEKVPLQAVVKKLKTPKDKVVQYSQTGYVLDRQYIISREYIDGDTVDYMVPKVDAEFKKIWDEVCLMINPKARG